MRKTNITIAVAVLFILLFTIPCIAWQGRMAGMDNPYGLVQDESDFLIHPAYIASGKGVVYYGGYHLTYDKTSAWNFNFPGTPLKYDTSGHALTHEGQAGITFPVRVGRMGVFLEYLGTQGQYKGSQTSIYDPGTTFGSGNLKLKDDAQTYAMRLLYGVPVGKVSLGGELNFSYTDEERKNTMSFVSGTNGQYNFPWEAEGYRESDLFAYQIPYRSQYWQVLAKVSAEGKMGSLPYAFTLKGGMPFSSDNKYSSDSSINTFQLKGDVTGWKAGGDFWLRYPVSSNLSAPFIVSVAYSDIERDGSAPCDGCNSLILYEDDVHSFKFEAGGGLDYSPCEGAKITGGLYYDFLYRRQKVFFYEYYPATHESYYDDYKDYPKQTEHRITLKFLGERNVTPTFALRAGFSAFYGKIVKDSYSSGNVGTDVGSFPYYRTGDGSDWGITAGAGATFKMGKVDVEPYINGGYRRFKTSGGGAFDGVFLRNDRGRTNWILGGGFAIKL